MPDSPEGQSREFPWSKNPELKKYYNLEYIAKIFALDDEPELKKFAEIHGWDEVKMERVGHYLKMRHEMHQQQMLDLEKRKKENLEFTPEEKSLGIYLESIEPQVRSAVRQLRAKGYSTYSSGFDMFDQQIALLDSDLQGFALPEDLVKKFKERGIKLSCGDDHIDMTFKKRYGLDELAGFWDEVVAVLPDLGRPARNTRRDDGAINFQENN